MHLAHFNWGRLIAPIGDPTVAEFVDAVPRVNAVAERSPGFVWRHGGEAAAGRAIGWQIFEDERMIASFSVWRTAGDFLHFVQRTVHGSFLKRRAAWFLPAEEPAHALWDVAPGHVPTIREAREKVDLYLGAGPSAEVYGFAEIESKD